MKIVIGGAGEVGTHLAKLLSRENQDIMVVDKLPEKLAQLDSNYNLMTTLGNPTSFDVLREAGVANCKEQGIQVNVWTVDDPKDIKKMIALGCDRIITNRPDVGLSCL